VHGRAALGRAVAAWLGVARHFQVALAPTAVNERVSARLRWLPRAEGDCWDSVSHRLGAVTDTLRFLALALDSVGRPIPIVNTDAAMLLLLDSLNPSQARELVEPIMLPYPAGLMVEDLGPLVANDAYASPEVWDSFRR